MNLLAAPPLVTVTLYCCARPGSKMASNQSVPLGLTVAETGTPCSFDGTIGEPPVPYCGWFGDTPSFILDCHIISPCC